MSAEERAEVRAFAAEAAHALRVDHASRAFVARVQAARFAEIRAAAARTPLYQRALGRGVQRAPLSAFPILEKTALVDDLQASFSDQTLRAERVRAWTTHPKNAGVFLADQYLVALTSGTSGTLGHFVNDRTSWARSRGLVFSRLFRGRSAVRDMVRFGPGRRFRMALVVATGGHTMTYLLGYRMPGLGSLFAETHPLSVETPLGQLVDRLNTLKPHLLHAYPSVLAQLAQAKLDGGLRIRPEMLTAGSETVGPAVRALVTRAFPKARWNETYASTECVHLASTALDGVLRVHEDGCILEVVDGEGRAVLPGTPGARVLVTNLLNTAQPLIRYALDDAVVLEDWPEPTGRTPPRRRLTVHGRRDDTLYFQAPNGEWQAHPPIPLELLLLSEHGWQQFQFVHVAQNELVLHVVPVSGADAAHLRTTLRARLDGYVRAHGLTNVAVDVRLTGALERPLQGHKIRQVKSMVSAPQAAFVWAGARRATEANPRSRR